jgi:hypothetical protein
MVAKGAITLLVVVVMVVDRRMFDGDAAVVLISLRSNLPFILECNAPESSKSELTCSVRRSSSAEPRDCGVLTSMDLICHRARHPYICRLVLPNLLGELRQGFDQQIRQLSYIPTSSWLKTLCFKQDADTRNEVSLVVSLNSDYKCD